MSELEDTGTDLSIYTQMLSDLVTDPASFADENYLDAIPN